MSHSEQEQKRIDAAYEQAKLLLGKYRQFCQSKEKSNVRSEAPIQ